MKSPFYKEWRENEINGSQNHPFFENQIQWLTSSEAAEHLKISIETLHNLTSSGKIPYYKLGKRNRFRLDELNQLLLAEKRGV